MTFIDDKIVSVDFNHLFGNDQNDISLERIEAFLNKCITISSELAKVSPNQLVRVVNGNQVTWMTQEQASQFLKEGNNPEIQRDVKRALKGELKNIRQELEILLALAIYTYNQYKKNKNLSDKDLSEIEPNLKRRKNEIKEGISQTAEAETLLKEKKQRNPILNEYELLMGEFLNAKNDGDMARAAECAKILGDKKKNYLRMAKSVEPDIQTIYYHRLNLQKTKKRIINTQNEICTSRKDKLFVELEEIQQNLKAIKHEFYHAEKLGIEKANKIIIEQKKYELDNIKDEYDKKSSELQALDQEKTILEKQEKECEQVIQTITNDVLQKQTNKIDIEKTFRNKQHIQKSEKTQTTMFQPNGNRMHIKKRED